jgi:coenzyme F420 hydrogenase subunit beta
MADMSLKRIVEDGLCTGCGACVFAATPDAVSMKMNSDGFLRPVATDELALEDEQAIQRICPGIGLRHETAFDAGVQYVPEWGPIKELKAGHATDEEVRHVASSGGVLSAILIHLLKTKQVDFVVHTRASSSEPLINEAVFSETREDILSAAGSRYAPAAPVSALPAALARPGRFAFVGKPCDVAAVRSILRTDPALKERIPYLLSFMCAGTPSIKGTHQILQRFDMKPASVQSFRYRGDGWPGLARAESVDGRVQTMDYNTAWGRILNQFLQPRCKMCADGTGEFADVVCADAWYGKDGYPDFEERAGRSLLITRTAVGSALASGAFGAGSIAITDFDVRDLSQIQPYQLKRKREVLARAMAARLFRKSTPKYIRLQVLKCARQLGALNTVRAFLGAGKRILAGRI